MESKQGPSSPESHKDKEKALAEKLERIKFIKSQLEDIDEEVLRDIFKTILRRAGQEEKIDDFISPKQAIVTSSEGSDRYAGFHPETKKILLNEAKLRYKNPKLTKTVITEIFIHEEVHGLSGRKIVNDEDGWITYDHLGFRRKTLDHVVKDTTKISWKLFNEGMTELIKDDVFIEYIHRTGDKKDFSIKEAEEEKKTLMNRFKTGRYLINQVFEEVSRETGVSVDAVREAFVQAYFSATAMEEIKMDIADSIGKDIGGMEENPNELELKQDLKDFKRLDALDKNDPPFRYLLRATTNYLKRSLTR